LPIVKPNYGDYFSPIAARRMAKGVKNGIVASAIAMKEAILKCPMQSSPEPEWVASRIQTNS
jgi:hypothetical protein